MKTSRIVSTLLAITLVVTATTAPTADLTKVNTDKIHLWNDYVLTSPPLSKLKDFNKSLNFLKCRIAVLSAGILLKQFSLRETIANVIINICTTTGTVTHEVCAGFVHTFKNEFLDALSYGVLTPEKLCNGSFWLYRNWTIMMPRPTRIPPLPPHYPQNLKDPLRILHLTDIHLDRNYLQGSPSLCLEPVCCHAESTESHQTAGSKARHLGEYTCDTSPALFDSLLDFISQNLSIDAIYWTGDSGPHDDWRQTVDSQAFYLKNVITRIRERLPQVPVYSVLGNHDTFPVNSFPSPSEYSLDSNQWVYNLYSELNSNFLPQHALRTVKQGGFYTVLLQKGLRVVSINTNFCEIMNFWMIIDNVDPFNQLSWLIDVLYSAEINNEKVHIIGHHPPGSPDCQHFWSYNFNRILSRFATTIVAVFTGHEHISSFQLAYNVKDSQDIQHAIFIGPSISPYDKVNPAFNLYHVDNSDNSDFVVQDYFTYSLDINAQTNPKVAQSQWSMTFTGKHNYDMPDLSPSSFEDLVSRMRTNDTLYKNFMWNYDRRGLSYGSLDKKKVLCRLLISVSNNENTCKTTVSDTT